MCNKLRANMNKSELANILRTRRKYLQITQKDLAEIVGIGLRSYVDIENGKANPTLEVLQKLSEALGLTLDLKVK